MITFYYNDVLYISFEYSEVGNQATIKCAKFNNGKNYIWTEDVFETITDNKDAFDFKVNKNITVDPSKTVDGKLQYCADDIDIYS